jgi:hypothetical protein
MLRTVISGLQGLNMAGRAQPFRKQAGGSQESFTAQTNVETAFGNLSRSIILDGVYLESISVGTSDTLVEHKLNRAFRGYIICKNDSFSQVKQTSANDVTKFLTLQATSACTISLWIF